MKKNLILVLIILLTISILTGCNIRLNYYEDKFYSEKDINKNAKVSSVQDSNTLTREKALKKALEIFDKGFSKKINTKDLNQTIRLSRQIESDNLNWNIEFKDDKNSVIYQCTMDTFNGKVIYVSCYNSEEELQGNYNIMDKEIFNIARPLFKELKIDPNSYNIKYSDLFNVQLKVMFFVNKKDKNTDFTITINPKNKTVVEFNASR